MPVIRFGLMAAGFCLVTTMTYAEETLTLARAEALATHQAPWLAHHRSNLGAATERAVYEGRLPDPQLTVGAANVPTNTFNTRAEDMTMFVVGVRQAFPPGDSLALKTQRAEREVAREQAQLEMEHRNLLKQVRVLWLSLYLEERSQHLLEASRRTQERLLLAVEGRYRAAQESQQAVLRARQALVRLEERLIAARGQARQRRAQLARFIGAAAHAPLPDALPELPALTADFEVSRHPEWRAAQSEIDMARTETDLARQEYKPGMMLDVMYGFRRPMPNGAERSDLISAQITVDLPLFRTKRQNPRIAEKQALATAAQLSRDDKTRELQAMYDGARAEYDALRERVRLYAERLVPSARREAEVTVAGFGRDANERRDAQMRALDAELELLRLRIDLVKQHAELLYLIGEEPA